MGDPTDTSWPASCGVAWVSDGFVAPLPGSPMRWAPTGGASRLDRRSFCRSSRHRLANIQLMPGSLNWEAIVG